MAFENLFIRTKKAIGGIELDAVLTESHTNEVTVTKNKVELGVDISDHAEILPKKLNITAQVSDTPLGTAALGQVVDLITGLFGTSTSANITRSNAAYNALIQLMDQREPIEIQTKLKLYSNMIITNISTTQDKDTSKAVLLNITIDEVIITESKIVKLDRSQLEEGTTSEQGTSAEKKGRVETVTPSDTTNKSVIKSVTDWIGG